MVEVSLVMQIDKQLTLPLTFSNKYGRGQLLTSWGYGMTNRCSAFPGNLDL